MRRCLVTLLLFIAGGCGDDSPPTSARPAAGDSTVQAIGVNPEDFDCARFTTEEELAQLLGGHVERAEVQIHPPPGVAKPCNFLHTRERTPEELATARKQAEERFAAAKARAKKRGLPTDDLEKPEIGPMVIEPYSFDIDCRAEYERQARQLMEQYRQTAGDAGAEEVAIGREGLDHHGVALIFLDADTPCYVRVRGVNAQHRQTWAKMLETRLTPETAPRRSYRRVPK